MGLFDSKSSQKTTNNSTTYDNDSYVTETNDSRKAFEGGGSDFAGVGSVNINTGEAFEFGGKVSDLAFGNAHDTVAAFADIVKTSLNLSSKSVYDSIAVAGSTIKQTNQTAQQGIEGIVSKVLVVAALVAGVILIPGIVRALR